jgi:uncharacterized protein with beta-barrel porin domain
MRKFRDRAIGGDLTARLRQASIAALLASASAVPAYAAGNPVINPGFETGDFTGWTTQGGSVGATSLPIDENWFTGPATRATVVQAGGNDAFTTNGIDNITGIPTVFAGNYAARINDPVNDYSATGLRQTVTNYGANKLYYAWNAVLQPSHGANDSPAFLVRLTDKTTNQILTNISYSAFTAQNAASFFRDTGTGWVTSDWKVENVDTVAGHDYEMLFVGVDCPYGGHAGYVYVDAFGNIVPTNNPNVTFNPATDVVQGNTFLIGGQQNIISLQTLSGLLGGSVNPVFDGGTLQIDSVPGGPVTVAFTVTNLNGVVDTNGNDVEFSGGITGTGTLTKIGDGTLMLSGINLINGGVAVNQGGLNVAGTLSTLVLNLNAGSRLNGSGLIVAAVNLNSGAVIAPGNSPGTLTIAASPLVMNAGSTYQADIDGRVYDAAGGAGTYDRIALTLGATFTAGGTLAPNLRTITGAATNTFTPVLGDRFTIVSGGAVDGAFATVTQPAGLAANTRFDVLYNPTSVDLVVTPGSFATLGGTAGWQRNAVSVGAALDAVRPAAGSRTGTLQPLFDSIYGLNAAGYGTAFQQLSGEVHAELLAVAREAAANTTNLALNVSQTMIGREGCASDAQDPAKCLEPTGRPALWTQLLYEKSEVDTDGVASGYENEQKGFAVGMHLVNASATRIGVGGRYSEHEFDNVAGSHAKGRGYSLFAYAAHDFGPLTVAGTFGWGNTSVNTRRAQSLPGSASSPSATYGIDTINAAIEARYTLRLGNVSLRPVAGLEYEQVTGDSFAEGNSAAPVLLSAKRESQDTTSTRLGLDAAVALGPVTLVANGTWKHVVDGDPTMHRVIDLGAASWTASSVTLKDDSFQFGGGLQAKVGARTSVRLEYAGVRNGSGYQSNQGFLRLAHAF